MTTVSTFRISTLFIMLCAFLMPVSNVCADDNDSTRYRVRARLSENGSRMKAKIDYRERIKRDRLTQRLVIRVKRGEPGETLDLKLDGKKFGEITLNSRGKGRLKLRSKSSKDLIRRMRAGQTIEIGSLDGELKDYSRRSSRRQASRMKLKAKLTAAEDENETEEAVEDDFVEEDEEDELEATSFYKERLKRGRLDRRFMAKVEHATPGATFDVFVNDHAVGEITANALGEGRIYLKRSSMYDSFPRLVSGDTVTIGTMTGALLKHGN